MLSYKQARAHAQQCGVDVSRHMAVPIERMKRRTYVLARDILHPENLMPMALAGDNVPKECAEWWARNWGIDYIVCYK
jgi:hypothetical protein